MSLFIGDFIDGNDTLDCHGLRREEAVAAVDKFLDTKFLQGRQTVCVIHGYGQGVLRQAISEYLENSPYVSKTFPGSWDIVVSLKERIE